jgi:hypothetical protein
MDNDEHQVMAITRMTFWWYELKYQYQYLPFTRQQ